MGRLAIIDGDHICYLVAHVKKDDLPIYPNGKPIDLLISQTDDYLKNILIDVEADKFIGCLTIGKCFRYDIYPEYKANRKDKPKMPYISLVKEYLKDKYGFIFHKNYEADDLCHTLRKNYSQFNPIVISPDKDILGLEGNNYDPKNRVFISNDVEQAEYNFWTQMIVGDTADNIKGLPGKGPAYAKKALEGSDYSVYPSIVLKSYQSVLGDSSFVDSFYANYKTLKVLDNVPMEPIVLQDFPIAAFDQKPEEFNF